MSRTVERVMCNGLQVRVLVDEAGDQWFFAKDVCDILGASAKEMRSILDSDGVSTVNATDVVGGIQQFLDLTDRTGPRRSVSVNPACTGLPSKPQVRKELI